MKKPSKDQIIKQLQNDNTTLWAMFFAILVISTIFVIGLSIQNHNLRQSSSNNICIPKYAGHYTNMLENYSVTVLDLNNQVSAQLDNELRGVVQRINSIQLRGGE